MEQLLRGQEISEVSGRNREKLDFSAPTLFFPVRHHSPVCAFHLQKAIAAYEPGCILIEGPANAGEMIPVLAHKDTKAPVALYYFYKDKKEDYKCYYPFLDCSPELVAVREAERREIPARFIDLPYGEILLGTQARKQTVNDDYLLSRSKYIKLLCEKTNLRSFDEIWEKYFEIGGLFMETEAFMAQMNAYCSLLRSHTPQEELKEDGCLLREQYMAEQIAKACREYGKVLVVTGGFHVDGLKGLLSEKDGELSYVGDKVKLHDISSENHGVYPLSYSMEAADAQNGYASGMLSPGFYQQVWEGIAEEGSPVGVYEKAVLHQLVSTGRAARRKKEAVSSYDEICALMMAKDLAALRGKREPGLFELRDAALSSFVKGECNPSTDLPLRLLQEINTGRQVGELCADAPRPHLLSDFEEKCKKYGFKIQTAARGEVELSLFTKKRHLEMSRFLYQMEFLETGFARRLKGADLVNRRDRNRIREIWSYRFSSQVLAALVDVSMAGGTVRDAARAQLLKAFEKSAGSRDAARLMTQGFLMGFLKEQAGFGAHMDEVLAKDGDFFSLAEGFSHLRMLYELKELYQTEDAGELSRLLGIAFQKIVQLLPSMAGVKDRQQWECMEHCLSLYQITGKAQFAGFHPVLLESFERLLGAREVSPGLEGAVLGLLHGYDKEIDERIRETAAGYLEGTEKQRSKSGEFLRGLFYTARDFIFARQGFLPMIDRLLKELSGEDFMKLLPELRQAFGYFTPLEIDRIAREAAALNGAEKKALFKGRSVLPAEYEYGEALDLYARGRRDRRGTAE